MTERPVERWAGCTGDVLRVLDAGDDDAATRVYTTLLPLPDGRVLPVGDWASSDLAAVRRRAAGRADSTPLARQPAAGSPDDSRREGASRSRPRPGSRLPPAVTQIPDGFVSLDICPSNVRGHVPGQVPLMPSKPDAPCAGCGKLLWGGATSLPPGQRLCQPCRRARKNAEPDEDRPTECGYCGGPFLSKRRGDGRWARACSRSCASRLRITEGTHPFLGRLARVAT